MQKLMWFTCGLVIGLTALSVSRASVPLSRDGIGGTVIDQRLSDIRVRKAGVIDFDASIREMNLAEGQKQFKESLPSLADSPRLKGPIQRVMRKHYHQR